MFIWNYLAFMSKKGFRQFILSKFLYLLLAYIFFFSKNKGLLLPFYSKDLKQLCI